MGATVPPLQPIMNKDGTVGYVQPRPPKPEPPPPPPPKKNLITSDDLWKKLENAGLDLPDNVTGAVIKMEVGQLPKIEYEQMVTETHASGEPYIMKVRGCMSAEKMERIRHEWKKQWEDGNAPKLIITDELTEIDRPPPRPSLIEPPVSALTGLTAEEQKKLDDERRRRSPLTWSRKYELAVAAVLTLLWMGVQLWP